MVRGLNSLYEAIRFKPLSQLHQKKGYLVRINAINFIASAQLSFFCSIGCMEISVDGTSALIGMNSLENGRAYNSSPDSQSNKSGVVDFDSESEETFDNSRIDVPSPSICFLDMHTLEVQD